jgi:hypothetical protein
MLIMLFQNNIRSSYHWLTEAAPAAKALSFPNGDQTTVVRSDIDAALAERCIR